MYISTWKSYVPEGNFSPNCINTLGHLLLDTMADSLVCVKILTNIISSNPSPHMVVPFILVTLHRQPQFQAKERKRGHTATNKLQAQRKS